MRNLIKLLTFVMVLSSMVLGEQDFDDRIAKEVGVGLVEAEKLGYPLNGSVINVRTLRDSNLPDNLMERNDKAINSLKIKLKDREYVVVSVAIKEPGLGRQCILFVEMKTLSILGEFRTK